MTSITHTAPVHRSGRNEALIALGLSVGSAVSLGFSRFAYALLLPPMRESLQWTYVEAGGLNTANAVGYIFGSVFAAWFSRRLGIKASFLASLFISALVLLASGAVDSYSGLWVLRALGGFSTAVLYIIGASLSGGINPAGSPQQTAKLVAIYITGVGSGIVISGLLIPPLLARSGAAGWPAGWIWMGFVSLAMMVATGLAVRAVPPQAARDSGALPISHAKFLWPTFASFALYAAGYVSYMTFIVLLIRQQGGSPAVAAGFWILLGIASVVGTLLWGKVFAKWQDGKGPAIVSVVVMLGALPVLIWPNLIAAFVSAVIFGGSFMAGPSSVTTLVRRLTAPSLATAAIAAMTVAFAVGQAVGPLLSGFISDSTGSISAGLWTAPVLLILAAVIAPLQRPQSEANLRDRR